MSSPKRSLLKGRRTPTPVSFQSNALWNVRLPDHERDLKALYKIEEYVARYPAVLEDFLLESTSLEYLEELLDRKRARDATVLPGPACPSPALNQKPNIMYSEIGIERLAAQILSCTTDEEICQKVHEVAGLLAFIVGADTFNVYCMEPCCGEVTIFRPGQKDQWKRVGPVGTKMTVSAHVAVKKTAENIADLPQDSRFPKGKPVPQTKHFIFYFLQ